jgi:hypothetical protein
MSQQRPAVRCSARKARTGESCGNFAMVWQTVCRMHCGAAPQNRAAAKRRIAQAKAFDVLARADVKPLGSPVEELLRVGAEVVGLKDILAGEVARLKRVASRDKFGHEQTRATLEAFERSLDRSHKVLADIARLGLEERLTALAEAEGDLLGPWLVWFVESTVAYLGVAMDDERWSTMRDLIRAALAGIKDGTPAPDREGQFPRRSIAPAPRMQYDGPST